MSSMRNLGKKHSEQYLKKLLSTAPVQRDCREERKTAEDDARQNPDGSIYIPQCTENGEFRQAQCHEATGICWCLDPKTWDPIPGYYAQNIVPNCSHITYRTFKGWYKCQQIQTVEKNCCIASLVSTLLHN